MRVDERRLAGAGHDRRAVLELAVVAEDDVQDRLGEVGVEALDLLDLAADLVVAERDLGLQAARVGQVDRQRVVVVGLGLADVVQERAGDRDSRSMPGKKFAAALTAWATDRVCSRSPPG